jgi:hypothetical protein
MLYFHILFIAKFGSILLWMITTQLHHKNTFKNRIGHALKLL